MFKHFSFLASLILLVTLPLQSIAATNMLTCTSMANTALETSIDNSSNETKVTKPIAVAHIACVEMQSNNAESATSANTHADHTKHQTSGCKVNCALLCANMCTANAMVSVFSFKFFGSHAVNHAFQPPLYASITLPNLQRPPIFLA